MISKIEMKSPSIVDWQVVARQATSPFRGGVLRADHLSIGGIPIKGFESLHRQ